MKVPFLILIILLIVVVLISLPFIYIENKRRPPKRLAITHEPLAPLPGPINGLDSLINAERTSRGLPPLLLDAKLNASATAKAQDMVANNYWAHVAPDGTLPSDLIDKSGYKFADAGENLATCHGTLSELVAGWVASPAGHLGNIIGDYTDFGFGYATEPDGSLIVVNHFGKARK